MSQLALARPLLQIKRKEKKKKKKRKRILNNDLAILPSYDILGIIRETRHGDHGKTGLHTDCPEWVKRRAREMRNGGY